VQKQRAPAGGAEEMVASTNGEKKPFIERGTRTTFSKMKKSRFRQKEVHVPTRDGGDVGESRL